MTATAETITEQTLNTTLVSMTPDAFKSPFSKAVHPREIIERIRSGHWAKEVEAIRQTYNAAMVATGDAQAAKKAVDAPKKALPGIMFAGVFRARGNEQLSNYSGLLCADMDNLDGGTIEAALTKARADQHVSGAFVSPTGTGVKIIFPVSGTPEQHDKATFGAVSKHVHDFYGLTVDEACKNLERLCYVSYDPKAFWKDGAIPLAPLPCEQGPTVRNGDKPRPTSTPGAVPNMAARRRIAEEVLGAIEWGSSIEGFCRCPGEHLHTTGNRWTIVARNSSSFARWRKRLLHADS